MTKHIFYECSKLLWCTILALFFVPVCLYWPQYYSAYCFVQFTYTALNVLFLGDQCKFEHGKTCVVWEYCELGNICQTLTHPYCWTLWNKLGLSFAKFYHDQIWIGSPRYDTIWLLVDFMTRIDSWTWDIPVLYVIRFI